VVKRCLDNLRKLRQQVRRWHRRQAMPVGFLVDDQEQEQVCGPAVLLDDLGQVLIANNDFVIIDCPPSLSLLTVNALAAADAVLVPIQTEYFALEGLTELLETVERVRNSFNPLLAMEGIVLTMFDERTNLARQVVDDIRQHFGDKVFETVIPRNIRLGEAPSFGKPVLSYDIKSKGAEAYLSLGRELLKRREGR